MKRLIAAVVLVLATTACTPDEAIWMGFAQYGNHVVNEAHVIVDCESEHNPDAVSPTNDHGIFQINIMWKERFTEVTGQPWEEVYNPFWNTIFARYLYEDGIRQGDPWKHWTCKKAL